MKKVCTLALLGALWVFGCKSDGETSREGLTPGELLMSSNSAACQQAMKCCGAMVRDEEPTVSIDEMKMSCSGVALAKTDEECDQFKADYVAMIESRQNEAPAVCK